MATGSDSIESRFDATLKRLVHRLFLFAPVAAAAKNERLGRAVRRRAELHLQAVTQGVPVFGQQLLLKLFQQALGGTHDVASLPFAEKREVVLRDHATVDDPDAVGLSITGLHGGHDFLERGTAGSETKCNS